MATSAEIVEIQKAVIRTSNSINAALIADRINTGQISVSSYISSLVGQAATGTKVALIVCNYVEGAVPTSARVDSLTAFVAQQYAAGQAGGYEPLLYAYQALGAGFADTAQFAGKISNLTLEQFITTTYLDALGNTPSAAQIQHFVAQYNFLYNLYIGAGIASSVADKQAKAATMGQILYYGGTGPATTLSAKADAWLTNAGSGAPAYNTPL